MDWILSKEITAYYRYLNLPVQERIDPLLQAISSIFDPLNQSLYCSLQIAVFLLGSFCLLRRSGRPPGDSFVSAMLIGLAVLAAVRFDPFFLKFHWFPFLICAFDLARTERRSPREPWIYKAAAAVLLIYLWLTTAGTLAVIGTLLAALLRSYLFSDNGRSGAHYPFVVVFVLAAALAWMPIYRMPELPGEARLAPVSFLTQLGHPAVGPDLQPLPLLFPQFLLELQYYKLIYQGLIFCFLAVYLLFVAVPAIFGIFNSRRKLRLGLLVLNRGDWNKALLLPLLVLFSGLLVLSVPEPGAAGRRLPGIFFALRDLIPGLALEPLPWLLLPFIIFSASIIFILNSTSEQRKVLAATLALWQLIFSTALSSVNSGPIVLGFNENHFARSSGNQEILPSQYVAAVYGGWIDTAPAGLKRLSIGSDLNVQAQATVNSEEAVLAIDKNHSTRWSTRRPQQPGDAITFTFDRTVELRRITISIRKFPTDFPRGIRLEGSTDGQQFETIYWLPDWLGPVEWTGRGMAYFGPQSRVIFTLPKSMPLRAVRFTQTSSDPSFDWSVGELLLSAESSAAAPGVDEDDSADRD